MLGIFSQLLRTRAFSLVEQRTGQTIASDLKISRVMIRLSSVGQRHLMEDGTSQMDSRTIEPEELVAQVFCPSADVLAQINNVLQDRSVMYKVISRGMVFDNMMCMTETLHQSGEMISATPVTIVFRRLLIENPNPVIFRNAPDSSLIDRGFTLAADVATSVSSFVSDSINTLRLR